MDAKIHSEFIQKSNLRGLTALFGDWCAIIFIAAFSEWLDSLFFYILSIWLIGSFQFAIGEALLHEASHNHLFRNVKWNQYFSILYTLPFFNILADYKKEHFRHHKHLGDKKQDHIAADYELYGLANKNLFIIWFIKPFLGFSGYYYAKIVFEKIKKHPFTLIGFWLTTLLLFAYLSALPLLFYYWFVPLFWAFSSFLYWSEISDHFCTEAGTRSDMSFLKNKLHHNNGFHALHHKYAEIPWYLLPVAYEKIRIIDPSMAKDESRGFFDTYQQMQRKKNKAS